MKVALKATWSKSFKKAQKTSGGWIPRPQFCQSSVLPNKATAASYLISTFAHYKCGPTSNMYVYSIYKEATLV